MKLHHVAYVVKNIEQFAKTMPRMEFLKSVDDLVQNAELALYETGGDVFVELISPKSAKSYTWNFLEKKGEGLHHICYACESHGEAEQEIIEKKMMKVLGPVPAVLFDQQVMFAMARNRSLIEFVF